MKVRRRNFKKSKEAQNFWPSFTDMISTIALVLFFLMLLAYMKNIITVKNLAHANNEISRKEERLSLLTDELDQVIAEVEAGKESLKLSEEQIEEQKKIIAESNRELGELRTRLQGIAVLRLDVLTKVKNSIESEIGRKNGSGKQLVSIGDNGNIVINEGVVFAYNSSKLKVEGKEILKDLADAFERVLDDEEIRGSIDAISIQGHTDDDGSTTYNRDLSAKRATTVVNYIMSSNKNIEAKYGKYFVSSGYSEFRPISNGRTDEEKAKNRRIEISVILKDAHIQDVINKYLEDSMKAFED